ncbi:hypothetical protein [Candidatus Enterovibrio escicola]
MCQFFVSPSVMCEQSSITSRHSSFCSFPVLHPVFIATMTRSAIKDQVKSKAVKALKDDKLTKCKQDSLYHKHSLTETAMDRYKQLLGPTLTLRDYTAKVGEALANMKTMNNIIRFGMLVLHQTN